MALILVALVLVILAVVLFLQSNRQQKATGLPTGRILYTDTGVWTQPREALYDPMLQLAGKPDYLVEQNGRIIPVEVKSSWAPALPYQNHIFQLAAYCYLVEKNYQRRPPYGILNYRNRKVAIDFTPRLEADLIDLLMEMRDQEKRGEVDRSHDDPARCAKCGYRSLCDQKI